MGLPFWPTNHRTSPDLFYQQQLQLQVLPTFVDTTATFKSRILRTAIELRLRHGFHGSKRPIRHEHPLEYCFGYSSAAAASPHQRRPLGSHLCLVRLALTAERLAHRGALLLCVLDSPLTSNSMLGGLLFSVMDTTIISTALVSIATDLHDFQNIYWVVLAYMLSYIGQLHHCLAPLSAHQRVCS